MNEDTNELLYSIKGNTYQILEVLKKIEAKL